ncbi:hypothetical protein MGSAQ_002734, partial [marine sediment metagenome]
ETAMAIIITISQVSKTKRLTSSINTMEAIN